MNILNDFERRYLAREYNNYLDQEAKDKGLQLIKELLGYCVGSPEHPIYHPERYLDKHIQIVYDRVVVLEERKVVNYKQVLILRLAALLHDILKHGKGYCFNGDHSPKGNVKHTPYGDYWQNTKHDDMAAELCRFPTMQNFMGLVLNKVEIEQVCLIVQYHMKNKVVIDTLYGLGDMKLKKANKYIQELNADLALLYACFSGYMDRMRNDDCPF
jgi:hypothetical protein